MIIPVSIFYFLIIEGLWLPIWCAPYAGPSQTINNGLTRFRFNFSLFPCFDFLHREHVLWAAPPSKIWGALSPITFRLASLPKHFAKFSGFCWNWKFHLKIHLDIELFTFLKKLYNKVYDNCLRFIVSKLVADILW